MWIWFQCILWIDTLAIKLSADKPDNGCRMTRQ
jgi:hypothetical protein